MTKGDPGVWLAQRLKPGDVVFDVGANEGHCAEHYANAGAIVYAIEPDARCWEALRERVPSATILPFAAAACVGPADLTLGSLTTHSSLRPCAVTNPAGTATVLMDRLDDILANPVAIKIDVQGCELDVLMGAPRLLFACPLWIVEIWPHGFPRQAETVADIYYWFEAAGKYPHTLDVPPVRLTLDELMAWCAQAQPYKFVNLAWMHGD